MHNDCAVDEESGKPEIVLSYIGTKGGVDSLDQMAHSFSIKKRTKIWPFVVFFNMIDCAGVAAKVVWSKKVPRNCYAQSDNRQQFLIQLAKELVFDQVKRRAVAAKTMNLPYRINLDTVLDSLSASCDQSGTSSKRQAMSSSSKKTPTSSTLSDSKFPASQKA
ncbi:PiggyBac transposable element-derived protein 4 [Plakobranchus ocellatus]|uniref:PiggyBac transposable element-derived protein 4 n=1 Tax=Plakobranchus ocellatus TaxID=259542 RepID=A0AAV4BYN3_9GAST|nr:PiggyBac transposable element-derived protein 4 [Plakobranchus ocellatus]